MNTLSNKSVYKPTTRRAQILVRMVTTLACGLGVKMNSKSISVCFRLLALSALLLSTRLYAADISMQVENITDIRGTLMWSVFDSSETYAADAAPVIAGRSRVMGDSIRVTLHGLPPGRYAVKLFHDANDNGEMDSNLLGLPQEGYGFSNNAGSFGPASFSDAMVEVVGDILITIRLR
jgi:uncharacterized protein (DUF2141 family)